MTLRIVVAVTDGEWFETLRNIPGLAEVNFRAPSGAPFKALNPGELFLFKLHAPRNFVVGGGIFAHANTVPCSLAWEAFEVRNGATSLAEMRKRIMRYRRSHEGDRTDFVIGCRILTQPFFLPEDQWVPVPDDWSPNIVSFKTYDTSQDFWLGPLAPSICSPIRSRCFGRSRAPSEVRRSSPGVAPSGSGGVPDTRNRSLSPSMRRDR